MNTNKVLLPISMLFALVLCGCNNTSETTPTTSSEPTTSTADTGSPTITPPPAEEATFEITSNMAATPTLDFQEEKYYVGEVVRFKVAESKYNIDSVTANGNALEKGEGIFPYSFTALQNNSIHLILSIQHATTPKNVTLTFSNGVDKKNEQIYNFWPENSGVAYDISTKATSYTISYELSIDTHLIDDDGNNVTGLGYGSNDEIQFNIPMYFWTTEGGSPSRSYGINMKLFKYGSLWVYRPLHGVNTATQIWTGDRLFDDHRDDALARNITKAMSRGGVKIVYSFSTIEVDGVTKGKVVATAQIGDTTYPIGTCTSLAKFNGQDNGSQQLRYMDFGAQFSTTLSSTINVQMTNFVVDYAVE